MTQAQEKIDAELKKLSRLDGNKTCVDCPEKVPLMTTFAEDAIFVAMFLVDVSSYWFVSN